MSTLTRSSGHQPEEPPVSTRGGARQVVFLPEPGECAGRLDPRQDLIPQAMATALDFHVWPSVSPYAVSPRARTVCDHVDYEHIWQQDPELFTRREHVGVPPPEDLWKAKAVLADFDRSMAYDVQLEEIDGGLALAVYGAGVVGRLSDAEWHAVAGLLTTCCSILREPRDDITRIGSVIRPARQPVATGKRALPNRVRPVSWAIGDWIHTWWGYPFHGTVIENCDCPAHTSTAGAVDFGPSPRNNS